MLFAFATAGVLVEHDDAKSVVNIAGIDRQDLARAESAYAQFYGPQRYGYGSYGGYGGYGGYGYGRGGYYRPRWNGYNGGYSWGGYGRRNYNRYY